MIWLIGVLSILLIVGAYVLFNDWKNSWRYKMTIEVETPEGLRTGYAVREVKHREGGGFWFGEGKPQWNLTGEAVAVDLPGGRTLFGMLSGSKGDVDYGARIAHWAMGEKGKIVGRPDPVELWPNPPKRSALKFSSSAPLLVTFTDINDPKSVQRVELEDLAASFGEGVSLKRIGIEITDDPVTSGIGKRLSWRKDFPKGKLNGDRFEDFRKSELSAHLSAFSFSTEPVE